MMQFDGVMQLLLKIFQTCGHSTLCHGIWHCMLIMRSMNVDYVTCRCAVYTASNDFRPWHYDN